LDNIFAVLENINARPKPFEFYTAPDLWTDAHTSRRMLAYHLDEHHDVASRKAAFIDRSIDWIVPRFSIGKDTRIADFGCGPGLYASRLAEKGAQVTAIDFSERSIAYAREVARQKQLAIHYLHQNYLTFTTEERFDLILMIMCDFCALSPEQRETMLRRFHAILKPGGYVLMDAYTQTAFEQREETSVYGTNLMEGFWSPKKYYGFLNTYKYAEEKVVLDKYTLFEAARVRTIYNWLAYFTPEDIEKEFLANEFRLDGVYADVAGSPYDPLSPELAVVAIKK
jgi:2-polyprenyl-3-methyl-5-hydroxy-6-metoxy-1,4-benzoquinol methylase